MEKKEINKKRWLDWGIKGVIIAFVIGILYLIFFCIIGGDGFCAFTLLIGFLPAAIALFIIGAITGYVYDRMKNKKREGLE